MLRQRRPRLQDLTIDQSPLNVSYETAQRRAPLRNPRRLEITQPREPQTLEHLDDRRASQIQDARDLPAEQASTASQLLDLALSRSRDSSWKARGDRALVSRP